MARRAPRTRRAPRRRRTSPTVMSWFTGSAFYQSLHKWLWIYKAWTWPPVIVTLALIAWTVYLAKSSGAGAFVLAMVIGLIGMGLYRAFRGSAPAPQVVALLLCVPLVFWGFWLIQPEWYMEFRHSAYFLWTISVAALLVWLSGHPSNVVAAKARKTLVALTVIMLIIGAWGKGKEYFSSSATETMVTIPRTISSDKIPTDVALEVLAQCESTNRQFADDGVTPLPNEEGKSSAMGKYQVLAKLHAEEAKKLGYDLTTEEGNEAFARYLYEKQGFAPWKETRPCWEKELVARGYSIPEMGPDLDIPGLPETSGERRLVKTYQLLAPPDENKCNEQKFPSGLNVRWAASKFDARYAVKRPGDSNAYKYTPEKSDTMPGMAGALCFYSLSAEVEKINIGLYQ